jgi:hypothetical protein
MSEDERADNVMRYTQVNALPEYVTSTTNYRIDFLSSVSSTLSHISSVLAPVVHSLNMTFDAYGSHPNATNGVVRLSVVKGSEIEPAPITPSEGEAWELMSGTVKHVFEGAVVAPSAMIGELQLLLSRSRAQPTELTSLPLPVNSQHGYQVDLEPHQQHLSLRPRLPRVDQKLPHCR